VLERSSAIWSPPSHNQRGGPLPYRRVFASTILASRTMLIDIYHRFTEGLGTADLKEAKNLLDELST